MLNRKIFNAILMVTGTSVGSGILGLPIVTSSAGVVPSTIALLVAWVFMTMGAYYILDIKMQMKGTFNLSSLIKLTLGRPGQYISSTMIVLLLYALLCTYMMAGAAWLGLYTARWVDIPIQLNGIIFIMLFGGVLLGGEKASYRLNNALGIALIVTFIVMVGSSVVPANYDFIQQADVQAILPSLPLILTTFGFSIVVPSLTEYLDYDEKSVKTAIIIGSLIALAAYILWEWVTFGNVSFAEFKGLKKMGDNGTGVIVALAASTDNSWVKISGQLFAIFAVTTSFSGVSLALMHFLADTLKLKNRVALFFMTYLPPVLVTRFYPKAFVQTLGFAGIFVAVLLGLFPVLMVFNNRQCRRINKGTLTLICVALFFIMVIIQEMVNLWN